jgi:hypothetical protein
MVHVDDESAQPDAHFTLITVVYDDQSLLIVDTRKHITHNAM